MTRAKKKLKPMSQPIHFGNGFYIEVRDKGKVKGGVRIKCEDKADMMKRVQMYERNNKSVGILGEMRDGVWLDKK